MIEPPSVHQRFFCSCTSLIPRPIFLAQRNERNERTYGQTHKKNMPGTHCIGCSAHVLKITQNLGNRISYRVFFRKLYSFNFLQWCFYHFFPPARYLFLDYNLGEVDSNQFFCGSSSKSKTVCSLCTCSDCSLFTIVRL